MGPDSHRLSALLAMGSMKMFLCWEELDKKMAVDRKATANLDTKKGTLDGKALFTFSF